MNARSRLFPHPVMSVLLLLIWLITNQTLDPAHIVLGALIGFAIPFATRALWPERLHFVRPLRFLRLLGLVLADIVIANVQVALLILGPQSRLRPAFFTVPLTLTNPYAISALASIITLTPGTVSADLSPDRRTLLVHALDIDDVPAMVAHIKARYEAPLLEIMQ